MFNMNTNWNWRAGGKKNWGKHTSKTKMSQMQSIMCIWTFFPRFILSRFTNISAWFQIILPSISPDGTNGCLSKPRWYVQQRHRASTSRNPVISTLAFFNLGAWARLSADQMVNGGSVGIVKEGNRRWIELPAAHSHWAACLDLPPGLKHPQIWTCVSLSECSKAAES